MSVEADDVVRISSSEVMMLLIKLMTAVSHLNAAVLHLGKGEMDGSLQSATLANGKMNELVALVTEIVDGGGRNDA